MELNFVKKHPHLDPKTATEEGIKRALEYYDVQRVAESLDLIPIQVGDEVEIEWENGDVTQDTIIDDWGNKWRLKRDNWVYKGFNIVRLGDSLEIRDNKIELLEEDLSCVHMYLDDAGVARTDKDGKEYSIVGRIKLLEEKVVSKHKQISLDEKDIEERATKYATNSGMMSYVFPEKYEAYKQALNDLLKNDNE